MFRILISLALIIGLNLGAQAQSYRLIFANFFGDDHPNSHMMRYFKKQLEQKSHGRFKVTIKTNNQAGGEERILELVNNGTIQMGTVGGLVKKYRPMLAAFEQPFLITDWEEARKVFLSLDFMRFIKNNDNGNILVGGVMANGFRQISSNFPIQSMQDLANLKIRIPLNPTFQRVFLDLGTNPIQIPALQLYRALKLQRVEGQDNPYSLFRSMRWYELNKYVLESNHIFSPNFILVSRKWYSKLDEEARSYFKEALNEAIHYGWMLAQKDEDDSKSFLIENGVEINTLDPKFKAELQEAASNSYSWFDQNVPGSKAFRDYVEKHI